VDELIREIFYFVNIKVSDKIYRLFEILSEVYIPEYPFNELNFFTYAYFVVMVVTEINNDSVINKPTFNSVLARVEQFSTDLAQNHAPLLSDMLARVTRWPFKHTSRGILAYYQPMPLLPWKDSQPEEAIINNSEAIYECALNDGLPVGVLYQLCSMVSSEAAICQGFLRLLVDQLGSPNRDPFLLQAISNVLEAQPNAAGHLWRHIL
jgi:hypothetical protein